MKKILTALALLFAFSAFAQEEVRPLEGDIRYLVTQNWARQMESLDYLSKQRKERIAYMWGGRRSEWKTYTNLYFNAVETKYEDSEERAEPDDEGYSWRKNAYVLRRNFEKNTVQDVIEMLGKTYIVEDSLYMPEWKIHNDLKEVAGHICMKAYWEDTVKNHKIVAWFAQDIPHSGGPERLCGLPGMILEADINNGAMVISADRIRMKNLTTELEHPKKLKGKKVKEAEYQEVIRKFIEEKRQAEEPYFWGMRY